MDNPGQKYSVELTQQQWDMVVLCMGYVYERADTSGVTGQQPIDRFARRVLRRRIDETITEVQSQVPGAGEGLGS